MRTEVKKIHIQQKACRGITFLEVLIALFVLSVGLLGLAGLQMNGLKNNHSAQLRTEATIQANNILERMRVNRAAALAGSYDITLSDGPPGGGSLAETDLNQWLTELSVALPAGDGAIATDAGTNVVEITIQWDDSKGSGGSTTQTFTMGSKI